MIRAWLVKLGLIDAPCEHWWRPAETSKGLARWCEDCERTELLSPAEFYAYFGELAFRKQVKGARPGVRC